MGMIISLHAEVVGERARVGDRALGGVARRVRDADDVLGAQGIGRDRGDEAGVDAAGDADEDGLEAVLVHVVARAGDEGLVDLGLVVEARLVRRRLAALACRGTGGVGDVDLVDGLRRWRRGVSERRSGLCRRAR